MGAADAMGGGGSGCLAGALRLAALAVLGPAVALRRWWSARKRGGRTESSVREASVPGRGDLCRVDLELDLPLERERAARRELTALVVRLAEALGGRGEVYHLVHRPPWEPESELRAVGPRLQVLGDRFHQHLGRNELESCTSVWLALPPGVFLGTLLDPAAYDPAARGEPDGLLADLPCRWGFAAAWRRREASVLFRLALYVPDTAGPTARNLVDACRTRLTRTSPE